MAQASHIVNRAFRGSNEDGEPVDYERGQQIDAMGFRNLDYLERQGWIRPIARRAPQTRNMKQVTETEGTEKKEPVKVDARPGAAAKK